MPQNCSCMHANSPLSKLPPTQPQSGLLFMYLQIDPLCPFDLFFEKMRYFWILFFDFCSEFDEISSNFRRCFRRCWNLPKLLKCSCENSRIFVRKSWILCTKSEEKLNFEGILTEPRSEKFESWFGPSPIEPFNQAFDERLPSAALHGAAVGHDRVLAFLDFPRMAVPAHQPRPQNSTCQRQTARSRSRL